MHGDSKVVIINQNFLLGTTEKLWNTPMPETHIQELQVYWSSESPMC